jgi:hypothetical protein
MAYLSSYENQETFKALLSGGRFGADVEPSEPVPGVSPGSGSYGNPTIPSTGPLPATSPIAGPVRTNPVITPTPTKFTPKPIPGKVVKESTEMIGKETFTPKSFTSTTTTTTTAETKGKTNIMPLVYIGGAGLLLYYLFKK